MKTDFLGMMTSAARRRLCSCALATMMMMVTYLFCHVSFLNNDDTNIMYAIAGYRTGTPYPSHRFINGALGIVISGLYRLIPQIPWWPVYQVLALAGSISVIFNCTIKLSAKAQLSAGVAIGACILLYLTTFVYPVLAMTFTLTAGMLGTAGAMLVLCGEPHGADKNARSGSWALSLALMAMAFFTRNSAGINMLCFWGAAVVYRLLREGKNKKTLFPTLVYGLVGSALFVCCMGLNTYFVRALNPADYADFEEARGKFTDYPHVTYEEDPAFFVGLGWDKTIYDLADNLCFLDGRINAETMSAVMEAPRGADVPLSTKLADTHHRGIAFFRGSGIAQYMVAVPMLLTVLAMAFYFHQRKITMDVEGAGAALLVALCTAAGAFILCFYLLYTGRFPVRTFQLICIPATALLTGLCLRLYSPMDTRRMSVMLLVALAGGILSWSLFKTTDTTLRYDKRDLAQENSLVEQYCMAHPENVYITDVTSLENIAAFTVYPSRRPTNLVDWGGTAMHSGWKEDQLALNRIAGFDGGIFKESRVLFVTEEDGDKLDILSAYLTQHWQAVGYERVYSITNRIAVYRFLF